MSLRKPEDLTLAQFATLVARDRERMSLRKPEDVTLIKSGRTLEQALTGHEEWLRTGEGLRALDLLYEDLSSVDFGTADLRGVNLKRANLRNSNLSKVNLQGTKLESACLEGADLRGTVGFTLDNNYTRGTQFSPVGMRWWACLCNWRWFARQVDLAEKHNDPWSILRQSYAGPRLFFLLLFVIVFALPYVGRSAFYSAVGPVERRLAEQVESRKRELETRLAALGKETDGHKIELALPSQKVILTVEGKAASVVLPDQRFQMRLTKDDAERVATERELRLLDSVQGRVEPRSVWQVLLKWDEGKVWPTVLAVLLIFYNVGVYFLISSVSPLRDEEERSGWSPAWEDYRHLIWVHRVVTLLFYVSVISFGVNAGQLLTDVVFVPKAV